MVKQLRTISTVMIVLFILVAMLIPASEVNANSKLAAKDKLPDFLSEVIGIDLTHYNKTNEGYSIVYPEKYGGMVEEEQISFKLESKDNNISITGTVDNGFVTWVYLYSVSGSITYSTQPSTDALTESRNILQRYQTYAQKYGINASHISSALKLTNSIPDSPPAKETSSSFNGMSDFTPSNTTSDYTTLITKQTSIWLDYNINGLIIPNKSVGMDFGHNTFFFSDTWNLFSIGSLSVVTKEEATSLMFDVAEKYCEPLQIGTSDGPVSVNPEWSSRMDVGLNMIPGQQYNNSLNKLLLSNGTGVSMGNTVRDPLALYPMWQAIFYFKHTISGIVGVQVNLWGDTKEIAYCSTYGYLGGSGQPSTVETEQAQPSSSADNSEEAPNTQLLLLSPEIVVCVVLAVVGVIVAIAVFWKKKCL